MKLWSILFSDSEPTVDTVPGGSQTNNPTSTTQPKIIVERTDANGSSRTITINIEGGNYNERIEGDYIQGQRINIDL
jgi:VCBS repeat-containing protein